MSDTTSVYTRSARLADRLERGARELTDFARSLTDAEWRQTTPGDGRPVGVIVHHVATVYPLEVHLAKMMAAGTPIVGVTWATVREMNAAHAVEHGGATRQDALALLAENSTAAADAIRQMTDQDLDRAVPVSLYGDAELTCQFMLEDHAVRHSYHHLSKLRAAVQRVAVAVCLALALLCPAMASAQDLHAGHGGSTADDSLAARVREATSIYRDINRAIGAGYSQFGGCVSGPEVGAMGVHFVNGALVDGTLDADKPEALIYEFKNGVARLVGVEFITPAPVWDAQNQDLPVLAGHHLQYFGAPNRYRLPALYELHVWAWRDNPNGTYVDWNPRVSCDGIESR